MRSRVKKAIRKRGGIEYILLKDVVTFIDSAQDNACYYAWMYKCLGKETTLPTIALLSTHQVTSIFEPYS